MDDGGDSGEKAREPAEGGRTVTVQMHDLDALCLDELDKGPQRCRIELPLVKDPDGNRAVLEDFLNGVRRPQETRSNPNSLRVESWQDIPVQATATVKSAVVADVVYGPENVDGGHTVSQL